MNIRCGKNNLGYADVQNLVANRDRLMEGYGDGSPKAIKKFVQSVRSNKVSDEFVDEIHLTFFQINSKNLCLVREM